MLESILKGLSMYLPLVAVVAAFIVVYRVATTLFKKFGNDTDRYGFIRQIIKMIIIVTGIVAVVVVSPLKDATRGQLLSFLGILISAAIALSSTTLLGNIMAGFQLRAFKNFMVGDFLKVGDYFGRVTERGLLHTEIQTEESNLVTLPNLYLASHPITVIRSSGTIISTNISLGYDLHRLRIEKFLLEAASNTGLKEPFVQVIELGDFSVTYRISGFLSNVKTLITARSHLREQVLDKLHGDGIEIVSPNFMNQRIFTVEKRFIPEKIPSRQLKEIVPDEIDAEKVIFDKAEIAEKLEHYIEVQKKLRAKLDNLQVELENASASQTPALEKEIIRVENWLRNVEKKIEERETEIKD
jgi:small-conductance mechanosensitive channel